MRSADGGTGDRCVNSLGMPGTVPSTDASSEHLYGDVLQSSRFFLCYSLRTCASRWFEARNNGWS